MLGWHVSVFRQTDMGKSPATQTSQRGMRLAVWQTGLYGLKWMDDLVKEGKVINLGGNGYPNRYTALAAGLLPHIADGPPMANKIWAIDEGDVIVDSKLWEGKTVVDQNEIRRCRPDEWLLIEVWDES